MRSVAGEPDLIEIRTPKNKHGPSGGRIYLRLDRARQIMTEAEPPDRSQRQAERDAQARADSMRDASHAAIEIARRPGIRTRELYAALRASHGGYSRDRVDTALSRLAMPSCRCRACPGNPPLPGRAARAGEHHPADRHRRLRVGEGCPAARGGAIVIGALDVPGDPPEHAGTVVFRVFWVFRRHATERVSGVCVSPPMGGHSPHTPALPHWRFAPGRTGTPGTPLAGSLGGRAGTPPSLGDSPGARRPRRASHHSRRRPCKKRKEMTAPHRELHRPASRRCCGGASRAERRA